MPFFFDMPLFYNPEQRIKLGTKIETRQRRSVTDTSPQNAFKSLEEITASLGSGLRDLGLRVLTCSNTADHNGYNKFKKQNCDETELEDEHKPKKNSKCIMRHGQSL